MLGGGKNDLGGMDWRVERHASSIYLRSLGSVGNRFAPQVDELEKAARGSVGGKEKLVLTAQDDELGLLVLRDREDVAFLNLPLLTFLVCVPLKVEALSDWPEVMDVADGIGDPGATIWKPMMANPFVGFHVRFTFPSELATTPWKST